MEFTFVLKDNNQRSFQTFFWFLFFLHFIVAGLTALKSIEKNIVIGSCVVLALLIVSGLIIYSSGRKQQSADKYRLFAFILFIALWFILSNYIAVIICIGIIVFALFVQKNKSTVRVAAEFITVKGVLSSSNYTWQQMDNVILKDGLLTIDCKDNNLLQLQVDEELTTVNQVEFNAFCRSKLS